ncbi:MAG TPA: hypothetical protein VHR66_11650 [Gemmataceae bacterium]|jgi:hypothetical protein|nr:hypothetical protein [Gemmataceae bacterium]
MKTDTRQHLGWAARFRVAARILGLTALFAALSGLFILFALFHEVTVGNIRTVTLEGVGTAFVAALMLLIGASVTALWLLFELLTWLGGSGRRSAAGANAMAQVLLALAVFVGLNYLGFKYFKRWDMTRNQDFTLPTTVADDLRKLDAKTTIVVLKRHKAFGQLSEQRTVQRGADELDAAYDDEAERKVVDKVNDLVDQFRLLGSQFHVVTLNFGSKGFSKTVVEETADRPGLRDAIAAAPENSIFFYADDRVETLTADEAHRRQAAGRHIHLQSQPKDPNAVLAYMGNIPRLSFNEFYRLDKTASKAANPGPDGVARGNLVLHPQGVESFARRVLAIQEKRPKVGLLVIHEVLSSAPAGAGREIFTAAGLRRSLEDHGFDVVDVVVKKWGEQGGPAPAAYTLAETQFERLEAELEGYDEERRDLQDERKEYAEHLSNFRDMTLDQLTVKYKAQFRRDVTKEIRDANILNLSERLKLVDERLAEIDAERRETDAQLSALLKNERAFEDRRVTDVKAKLTRLTADCDMLIVPRLTVMNASAVEAIDPSFYKLSAEQVAVVKDFMKTGKPVLVCAGPNAERNSPAPTDPLDDLERLLADRGVQLGRETIITNAEQKGFAAGRAGNQLGGATTDLPPVAFATPDDNGRDNPIASAMRATAASADQKLDLKINDPRPVYVSPEMAKKGSIKPEFLLSPAASWNEENPMVIRNIGGGRGVVIPPRFKPTPFGDRKKGTPDEVRRGPFPIGVAIETTLPIEWYNDEAGKLIEAGALATPLDGGLLAVCLTAKSEVAKDKTSDKAVLQTERKKGRLAVIGQGGVFTGKQLSPAQEQLLLHTCNWLLNREDRLPRTDAEWSYPRLNRDEKQSFVWKFGPFLGLPMFFLYLGLIVWIVRRVR